MPTLSTTTTRSSTLPFHEKWREKLITPQNLKRAVESFRNKGKTIATLNGSFDLLHAGHLHIIFEASKQADLLIVALNTDASIKRYKSPDRPIVDLENRLQMVAALGFVDYVTFFGENDPRELLKVIQPDVHCNGADYGPNCIEAQVVNKIHLIDLIPGLSTSKIIRRIRCD